MPLRDRIQISLQILPFISPESQKIDGLKIKVHQSLYLVKLRSANTSLCFGLAKKYFENIIKIL